MKETCSALTLWKHEDNYSFLKEADSVALQQSLRDLDRAYKNFFEGRAGHPKFKSKHDNYQSYRTENREHRIYIKDGFINLPKIKKIKIKCSFDIDSSKIRNVTIKKTPSEKYYASICFDFEPVSLPKSDKFIGIDVGIKEFCATSDSDVIDNPHYLEQVEKKLAREQRRLSRKQRDSKNHEKQRIKVARIHDKVANQRNDFLQKTSTKLIYENQIICIEDLDIEDMLKNHRLAKYISSVAWSKFFDMLEYKAKWYGRTVIKIPMMYPSSQICHKCGYKNTNVKNLAVRKWICPMCGTVHDRDINAAINILNKGLNMLAENAI